MLSCNIRFSAPSFWMGGGLEGRCLGRVYGADGAPSAPYTRIYDNVIALISMRDTVAMNNTPFT